jgi:RHS repeat-associated protein
MAGVPQTGLVRFGVRDYDAQTGRWMAKDPISFACGDTNLYSYVGNDRIDFLT